MAKAKKVDAGEEITDAGINESTEEVAEETVSEDQGSAGHPDEATEEVEEAVEAIEEVIDGLKDQLAESGAVIEEQAAKIRDLEAVAGNSEWIKVLNGLVESGNITREELYARLSIAQIEAVEGV